MSGKGVWLVLFLLDAGYWATRDSTHNSTTATTIYSADADSAWAEQHSIDDLDSCDQAGETSNSPPFAEGCKAYVEENEEATDDNDRQLMARFATTPAVRNRDIDSCGDRRASRLVLINRMRRFAGRQTQDMKTHSSSSKKTSSKKPSLKKTSVKKTKSLGPRTIGIDIGDQWSHYCVLDGGVK